MSHHYLDGVATGPRLTADERRRAVLAAAVPEFAANGLEGTSTEDIARRAGISQPYLFRLFPSKKALFLATVEATFSQITDRMTSAVDGLVDEDAACALGEAYQALLVDRDILRTQLHAYAACDDPDVRAATRRGFRSMFRICQSITPDPAQAQKVMAIGMLMTVAAALDLPALDEEWAQICTRDLGG